MASSLIGRLSSLSFRVWKPTAVVAAVGINMVSALDNFLGQIRYRSNRSRRGLYDGRDIRSVPQGYFLAFDDSLTQN